MYLLGPNYQKLKTNLRLAMFKLKLLQRKKTELSQKTRKEIADLIVAGKFQKAKFKVEHIIREDYFVDALEIIEMYCDLLLARFTLISSMKNLDEGIAEAVSSLIWVAPHLTQEVKELKVIADLLGSKYGSQFSKDCREEFVETISDILKEKLSMATPSRLLVENYMIEISKKFNVYYVSDPYLYAKDQDNKFGGSGGSSSASSSLSKRKMDFSLVKEPESQAISPVSSSSFNLSTIAHKFHPSISSIKTGKSKKKVQPDVYSSDDKIETVIQQPQDSVDSLTDKENIKSSARFKEGSALLIPETSLDSYYDRGFNLVFEPDQYINDLSNMAEDQTFNLPSNQQPYFFENEELPQVHAERKDTISDLTSESHKECYLPILSPVTIKKRVLLETPVSSNSGLSKVKSAPEDKNLDVPTEPRDKLCNVSDLASPSKNKELPSVPKTTSDLPLAFIDELPNHRDLTNKSNKKIFDSAQLPFDPNTELENLPSVPKDEDGVRQQFTLQTTPITTFQKSNSNKIFYDLLIAHREKEATLKLPTVPTKNDQTLIEANKSPNASSVLDREDYVIPKLPSVPHLDVSQQKDVNLEELYKRFNKLKKK